MRTFFLYAAILSYCLQLRAQPHADCTQALEICSKQPLHLVPQLVPGSDPTELDAAACFANALPPGSVEGYSTWIRFTAAAAGSFAFIATPDSGYADLAFVLFRLPAGDCSEKTVLRCMASGDNQAASPCMGATGLLPGETDVSGSAGCNNAVNNFLAPVELEAGAHYALAINNFTEGSGFTLEFCGAALLGCETETCSWLIGTTTPERTGFSIGGVYPNPAASGQTVSVVVENDRPAILQLTLFDALGRPALRQTQPITAGEHVIALPAGLLPAGLYRLVIAADAAVRSTTVFIE